MEIRAELAITNFLCAPTDNDKSSPWKWENLFNFHFPLLLFLRTGKYVDQQHAYTLSREGRFICVCRPIK